MANIKEHIRSLGTNKELEELIINCAVELPERTIIIVRALYNGDSIASIARKLGISHIRVSQLAVHGYRVLMKTKTIYKSNPLFRGLSTRAYNCLVRTGLDTPEKVISYINKNGSLSGIRNMGTQTQNEVLLKLVELGYRFRL